MQQLIPAPPLSGMAFHEYTDADRYATLQNNPYHINRHGSIVNKATAHLSTIFAKARELPKTLTEFKSYKNDNYDNENYDLIIRTSMVLTDQINNEKYTVVSLLGKGTFGQVVKCINSRGEIVAIKVIKSRAVYTKQAQIEIQILQQLNQTCDARECHILEFFGSFEFHKHICMIFPLFGDNLYENLKKTNLNGFSLERVQSILYQLLKALLEVRKNDIIHCDLKPENIVLRHNSTNDCILIDFGSACYFNKTTYPYIQSRYYRSPEVILGCGYSPQIDIWSLGCIAVELFLGSPLFPGIHDHDVLLKMCSRLGDIPTLLFCKGKQFLSHYYIKTSMDGTQKYQIKSNIEYESDKGKHYAKPNFTWICRSLDEHILSCERSSLYPPDQMRCFLHFVHGLLEYDPMERYSPNEALSHPFITGHSFPPMFKPIFDQLKLRYKDPEPPTSKPPVDRTFIQPIQPLQIQTYFSNQDIPTPLDSPYTPRGYGYSYETLERSPVDGPHSIMPDRYSFPQFQLISPTQLQPSQQQPIFYTPQQPAYISQMVQLPSPSSYQQPQPQSQSFQFNQPQPPPLQLPQQLIQQQPPPPLPPPIIVQNGIQLPILEEQPSQSQTIQISPQMQQIQCSPTVQQQQQQQFFRMNSLPVEYLMDFSSADEIYQSPINNQVGNNFPLYIPRQNTQPINRYVNPPMMSRSSSFQYPSIII